MLKLSYVIVWSCALKGRDAIKVACKRAISNILYEGISDVTLLERPFEITLLNNDEVKAALQNEVIDRIQSNSFDALKVKSIKHVLIPSH